MPALFQPFRKATSFLGFSPENEVVFPWSSVKGSDGSEEAFKNLMEKKDECTKSYCFDIDEFWAVYITRIGAGYPGGPSGRSAASD